MKRVITAVALLLASYYLIFWAQPQVFLGAALLVSILCYREYAALVEGHGIPSPGLWGLAGGALLLLFPQYTLSGLAVLVIAVLATGLRFGDLKGVLPFAASVLLGVFYAFAPWRFAVDLREHSVHFLFFALALNWAGDSIAYYFGRRFGRHKLAPVVSPKKSVEGAAASVAGSILFGLLYLHHFLPRLPTWEVIFLAILGNVAGQLGDLCESALKRGAGVKDSGTLLPGHGGMLDRLDSSLFTLPVVYVLRQLLAHYLVVI